MDASDYLGTPQEYMAGYREQVQFVNQRILQVIDEILRTSQTPPIIIVQGDHGPGAMFHWDALEESCLPERLSILNAYYLPDGKTGELYDAISPVNSFRVVFNTYFGTDLNLLEDRTYAIPRQDANLMADLTGQRTLQTNCTP